MTTVTQTACGTTSEAGISLTADRGFGFTIQTGYTELIGSSLSSIKMPLKKSSSGVITGIVEARVYNSSGVLQQSSDQFDVSSVTPSFVLYEFTFSTSHTLANGDFIGVCRVSGGEPTMDLLIQFSDTTCYANTNSAAINPPTITQYTSWDAIFEAELESSTSGGARLPPPPAFVRI